MIGAPDTNPPAIQKVSEMLAFMDEVGIGEETNGALRDALGPPNQLRYIAHALELYDVSPQTFQVIFPPAKPDDGMPTWSEALRKIADEIEDSTS